ncbi:hypothetical protein K502DRAFT_341828 [Neoconidiobolus thromboides FSU 785]|nr:hypothetical protein K502DRAFT_341828 [Neoconidiobolus thromboides FSU 785]
MESKENLEQLNERRKNLHYVLTREKEILDTAYNTLYDRVSRLQIEEQILLVFLERARENEGLPFEDFQRSEYPSNDLNDTFDPVGDLEGTEDLAERIMRQANTINAYKRSTDSNSSDSDNFEIDDEESEKRSKKRKDKDSKGDGSDSEDDDDETARMALRELLDQYEQDMQ